MVSYKGMFGSRVAFRFVVTVCRGTMSVLGPFVFALLLAGAAHCEDGSGASSETAADVLVGIFDACLRHGSISCVKPEVSRFLQSAIERDEIRLTRDLSVVRTAGAPENWQEQAIEWTNLPKDEAEREKALRYLLLERIDDFLNSHRLRVKIPREIASGEMLSFAPVFLRENIPDEVSVPLSETKNVVQERGFMKKVMIPFLLGLKFKATLFIPLAIALIALKTWKALTLGLLSLVLSGAMVIFKFTKPKVVNYEVYHYPSHHAGPMVEHPSSYGDHGYGRHAGQSLAYRAHVK